MTPREPARSSLRTDAMLALLLFVAASALGAHAVKAFRSAGGVQDFYQLEFGPAVMVACGHGYRAPDFSAAPALAAFLRLTADRFDCASLPAALPVSEALDPFHRTSRYLELSVAAAWRITGISWSGLTLYGGVMYGAVACLVFAIARVTLRRSLACLTVVPVVLSTLNLAMLPHYRDYAKAPFILAMILVMSWLVALRDRPRAIVALAAAGGAVAGVGLGFRNDMLITIPPFVIVVLTLTPWDLRHLWLTRAAALGAFCLSFALLAWPVLGDYAQGSNTGHVILLGLMDPFDRPLGVTPSLYSFGHQYSDSLGLATIDSYARRIERRPNDVVSGSRDYDVAAGGYLREIVVRFPGDLLTRAAGAAAAVPHVFLEQYQYAPFWTRSAIVKGLYRARTMVETRLAPIALIALGAAVLVVASQSPRAALFLLLVVGVFAGGAATQFNERHFFHLEFLPWWAFAFLAQTVTAAAVRGGLADWRGGARRAAMFAAACVLTAGGVLLVARAWQDRQVRMLFESYASAPRTPVPLIATPIDGGRVRFSLAATSRPELQDDQAPASLRTSFIAASFGGPSCAADAVPVTLRYDAAPATDLSRDQRIAIASGTAPPTRLFFPAYDRGAVIRFRGIELDRGLAGCVTELARVDDPEAWPLLLHAVLTPSWTEARLHQTLSSWR